MNNVLSAVQATRTPFESRLTGSSDSLLSQLVLLHEEMIVQLRLERMSGVATPAFLKSMIEQHEQAAVRIRSQLVQCDTTAGESHVTPSL